MTVTSGLLARRRLVAILLVVGVIACVPAAASAQSLTLTLSSSQLSFSSADPDTYPSISAPTLTVTYRVRNNWGSWVITLLASGDLSSGSSTIDVSHITWVATPSGTFASGTMSATSAQRLASGTGNVNPARTGQVTFTLANSWSYDIGTYYTTFSFTLTAP
jgi:hypothetical protein